MATFRVHLSSDSTHNAVTNLITGIGDVRDIEGNDKAHALLDSLISEIAFVRSYILNNGRSKSDSIVCRADDFANEVLNSDWLNAGSEAIHP